MLDTWFSSGIWPFVTLGWPEQTAALRAFYPTDVLSTARDILFLWVARMVMFGLEFAGDIPFDDVYVHPVIQAPDGRRMSKSLGTGIDPLYLIEGGPRPPVFEQGGDFPAYGADAVRFGLLAGSSTQDVRFNEERVAQGRQLANKLWNASRLVLLRVPRGSGCRSARHRRGDRGPLDPLPPAGGRGRRGRGDRPVRVPRRRPAALRLRLRGAVRLVPGDDQAAPVRRTTTASRLGLRATLRVALHVLGETLALAHPIIPFVTEEIWSLLPGTDGLLMVHRYPEPDDALRDDAAEADVRRAIAATQELRGWRDRVGAAAGKAVPARLEAEGYELTAEHIARLARVEWSADGGEPVATVGVPGGQRRRGRLRDGRSRGGGRARRGAAGDAPAGDRARRGQARQPGLRRESARRRRREGARKLERYRRELEDL